MKETNGMTVWTAGLAAACLLAGCGGVTRRVHGGTVDRTIDQTPDRGSYLEAIGIGAADPNLPTDTQRKSLARDAAIVKAQYELLSMIKGVRLDGGVTVQRALETDSVLAARVHETIRGAEIRKSEFTADGGCVVTLRLRKSELEKSLGARVPVSMKIPDGPLSAGVSRALRERKVAGGRGELTGTAKTSDGPESLIPGTRVVKARATLVLKDEGNSRRVTGEASALDSDEADAADKAVEAAGYRAGLELADTMGESLSTNVDQR